jgi:hypothetical protein
MTAPISIMKQRLPIEVRSRFGHIRKDSLHEVPAVAKTWLATIPP